MSKNLIPEIAKLLGVEIGEEFKIKGDDELTYTLTDDGLKITFAGGIEISQVSTNSAFVALVMGKDEIVKLPWKPKKGEGYWTFNVFFGSGKWAIADSALLSEALKLVYLSEPTVLVSPRENPLVTDYVAYVDFAFGFGDARAIIFSDPSLAKKNDNT